MTDPPAAWIEGAAVTSGGPRRTITNPASEQAVGVVADSGAAEVDAAVDAAREALRQTTAASGAERARWLDGLAGAVLAARDELAATLTAEQGKPVQEARLELERFVANLRYYAGLAALPDGVVVARIGAGVRADTLQAPIGVCAAIVPWNFPVGLLGNKLGPAIAAGNAVVVKPAETTPLTTLRIAALAADAGLPAGVVNVVCGGAPAGAALVEHPGVAKIAFTGSTAVGQAIARSAAASMVRLTLELGGSDPMVVLDDADVAAAARGVATGRFFNCGQVCVATKRVYVHESVHDAFVAAVAARVERLTVGDGARGAQVGPLHSAAVLERYEAHAADAVASGRVAARAGRPDGAGHWATPLVVSDIDPGSVVFREEVFGPLLPVVRVASLEEAVDLANAGPFALGASVWGADVHRARAVAEALRCGYGWINSTQRVHRELPFGGLEMSGYGREHGVDALDEYRSSRTFVYPEPRLSSPSSA